MSFKPLRAQLAIADKQGAVQGSKAVDIENCGPNLKTNKNLQTNSRFKDFILYVFAILSSNEEANLQSAFLENRIISNSSI